MREKENNEGGVEEKTEGLRGEMRGKKGVRRGGRGRRVDELVKGVEGSQMQGGRENSGGWREGGMG